MLFLIISFCSSSVSAVFNFNSNSGLPDMALMFAKAITGNISQSDDLPRLLDIGYVVDSSDNNHNSYNNGIWMSILNKPVNIGGRQYKYDNELGNWVGILTSTVYYSDLNGGILDDVLSNAAVGNYQLKARLCSYNVKDRKYLAEIDLSVDDITGIRDKTSAIFTWYTELLYNEETNSNLYSYNNVLELFDEVHLHHYPDQTKSRSSYLPLLELRVKENITATRAKKGIESNQI